MLRIQVSTNASGTGTLYTFPVNPSDANFSDSFYVNDIETLHGAPAWQEAIWDGRPRSLFWTGGYGATTTVLPSIANFVSSMKSWKGKIRYFNFRDINSAVNWPTANTWKKARIINVQTKLKPKGQLRYDSVELVIQPEV